MSTELGRNVKCSICELIMRCRPNKYPILSLRNFAIVTVKLCLGSMNFEGDLYAVNLKQTTCDKMPCPLECNVSTL